MKGYRLFDSEKQKVVYCRDIQFNEDEVGLKGADIVHGEPNCPVDVEFSSDIDCDVDCDVGDVDCDVDCDSTNDVSKLNSSSDKVSEPRRSSRERHKPDYYSHSQKVSIVTSTNEPSSFKEAVSSQNKEKWKKAMEEEINLYKKIMSGIL